MIIIIFSCIIRKYINKKYPEGIKLVKETTNQPDLNLSIRFK